MAAIEPTGLYTYAEVAKLCRVSPLTVKAWGRRGYLKVSKMTPTAHRITGEALLAFVRERTTS
jgi:hypothetical protein